MRMMFLLLIIVPTASAQYDLFDLATSGDGSTAYFASTLSLAASGATSPAGAPGRIFRVNSDHLQLHLERDNVEQPLGTDGYLGVRLTNYFNLSRPQVSQDGRVVAVVGMRSCSGGQRCTSVPRLQTTVTGLPNGTVEVAGAGSLSRNGRYLFLYENGSIGGGCSYVLDLHSSPPAPPATCLILRSQPPDGRRVVSDDGTAVIAGTGLDILRNSTVRSVPVSASGNPLEPSIDAAGTTVVYILYDWNSRHRSLRLLRLSDGRQSTLISASAAEITAPQISADGQRVLYLSNSSGLPQLYLAATNGGQLRQVSREPSGVVSAVLSDDGKFVWYFSRDGRLFQQNLETGEVLARLARTPQVAGGNSPIAGSYNTIFGAGFSDVSVRAQSYPLPRTLGNVTVTVDGIDSPLLAVSPTTIEYQAPSQARAGAPAVVHASSSSPFVPRLNLAATRVTVAGRFFPNEASASLFGSWDALAIRQDWSGVITAANPALSGEIVHLYGTNFGTVDRRPEDGIPSPADPPARTLTPITCQGWTSPESRTPVDVPVHFAGLAPGLVGIYQLDVKIPVANLGPALLLRCAGEGDNRDFYGSFAVKP